MQADQSRSRWEWLAENGTNAVLAALWTLFAFSAFSRWRMDGSVDMLLLFVANSLFAGMFIFRRRGASVSTAPLHWIATAATVALSFRFVEGASQPLMSQIAGVTLIAGLLIVILGISSLGRSFGLVPANRGIKDTGMYRCVRHPLYAGEIIVYLSFVARNQGPHNVLVLVGILCGLCYRAWIEERFLSKDDRYCEYLNRVRYRFIPGVY